VYKRQVLDPTLLGASVAQGIQAHTKLIVNTKKTADDVRDTLGLEDTETWTVDATEMAMKALGRPITNTVMLGAVVKATGAVELDSLVEVVVARFGGKIGELNAQVVKDAYKEVVKG